MHSMKQLTIRGVTKDLEQALQEEKRRRGKSLNQVILDLLRQSLGCESTGYDNGLGQYAGTWRAEELKSFEELTDAFEQIDEELWK